MSFDINKHFLATEEQTQPYKWLIDKLSDAFGKENIICNAFDMGRKIQVGIMEGGMTVCSALAQSSTLKPIEWSDVTQEDGSVIKTPVKFKTERYSANDSTDERKGKFVEAIIKKGKDEILSLRKEVIELQQKHIANLDAKIIQIEHQRHMLHWQLTKIFENDSLALLPDGWLQDAMNFLKGSLEEPGPTESERSIEARRLINAECRLEPPVDPMDWPLPADVTVGPIAVRKGESLSKLVAQIDVMYEMTSGEEVTTSFGAE